MNEVPGSLRTAIAVLLAALLGGVLLSSGGEGGGGLLGGDPEPFGPALADPIPYDGRSPAQPAGARERVLVELPRPALGELEDVAAMDAGAQRAYVSSLEQEADALLSALDARGVETADVVKYTRAWHGFSATVDPDDLPGLESLGVHVRANRRFYPALSEPVVDGFASVEARGPEVAVLAGGRAGGGYDAVDRDDEPRPARGEVSGVALAAALAAHGARPRTIRVSTLRAATGIGGTEEFARADELLDGLEHAVDPDSDGDTSDRVPVALVGVNAPYAGFAEAPEAQAARGAGRLGTTVVAGAGHEGPGTDAVGTIGSPAASRGAIAVAPFAAPGAVARTRLQVGAVTVEGAAVLGGVPPRGTLSTAEDPERFRDRLAVVPAGANPAAQAADAAAAGAGVVLLAQPETGRPLPTMPAGRVPVAVLGVTGEGAQAILDLDPGAVARTGRVVVREADVARARPSPFASRGPSLDGAPKPEVGRLGVMRGVAGAAIAAAAVAADIARGGRPPRPGDRARPPRPPRLPVGRPEVRRDEGSTGVAFTVGRFERGDPAAGQPTTILPAVRLDLVLQREDGALAERLTPSGGERGLLPGEYAYTLRRRVLADLEPGAYVFRVSARGPRQRRPTVAVSEPFTVR